MEKNGKLAPHPARFKFSDPVFGNPEFADDCYVSESSVVIGHVIVQSEVIICTLAAVRADEGTDFLIEKGSNIQDHCCLHGHKDRYVDGEDGKKYSIIIGSHCTFAHGSKAHGPLKIGKKCFVGFNAVLHASTIGRNCFIGHSANIKDAVIGENCHIGIGAIIEGVTIGNRRYVRPGQIVICQLEADGLPHVPKEMAERDSNMNKSIVDENKHLCQMYHERRLEVLRQKKV